MRLKLGRVDDALRPLMELAELAERVAEAEDGESLKPTVNSIFSQTVFVSVAIR